MYVNKRISDQAVTARVLQTFTFMFGPDESLTRSPHEVAGPLVFLLQAAMAHGLTL